MPHQAGQTPLKEAVLMSRSDMQATARMPEGVELPAELRDYLQGCVRGDLEECLERDLVGLRR